MNIKRYRKCVEMFQALAHPVRLQILSLLAQEPVCVCDLVTLIGQRQAYISQQLAILRNARLVCRTRLGKRIQYELVRPVLAKAFRNTLEELSIVDNQIDTDGFEIIDELENNGYVERT